MVVTHIRRFVTALLVMAMLIVSFLPVSQVLASTKYEYYTDYDTGTNFAFFYSGGYYSYRAQTFTPTSTHTVSSIKALLYRNGSPGTLTFWLYSTYAGHPNIPLTSGTTNGNTLTTSNSGEWREITFSSPYTVYAYTKYAIVGVCTGDTSNDAKWVGDNTSPTYYGGNHEYSDDSGVSWTSFTSIDLAFEVWGGAIVTTPTVTTQDATDIGSNSATGNGNITDTGGENCTIRGFCWDEEPYPTRLDNYTEEEGSFGTGAFSLPITNLELGQTYYLAAYAYNSAGWGFTNQVSFTTTATTPTIVVNDASNIAKTSARLNSTLSDDGGDTCEVRFGYGDETQTAGNFANYDVVTDWVDGYTTGEHPYYNASSLVADTGYFFRVQAKNDEGTVTSDEETFTTEATVVAPTNFRAVPYSTSVELSWIKGSGAAQTMIRYSFDAYPADETDGIQLYEGARSSYTHTGLSPGTTIYYTAFSESGGEYSSGTDVMITTLAAGAAGGLTTGDPNMPTNWFLSTDYTTMSNMFFYDTMNDIADGLSMPYSTVWLLAALIGCTMVAFVGYNISHQNTLAAAVTFTVAIGITCAQQLVPLYILFISLAVIAGLAVTRRQLV